MGKSIILLINIIIIVIISSSASSVSQTESTSLTSSQTTSSSSLENDNQRALSLLEQAFHFEFSFPFDESRALSHYNLSARLGNKDALFTMGTLHSTAGLGVTVDPVIALSNYHVAAMNGHKGAQRALGYRYLYGIGVPKNCTLALTYYELVANAVMRERDGFPVPPTIPDVDRIYDASSTSSSPAERQTNHLVEYYTSLSESGNPEARLRMGFLYLRGTRSNGASQDFDRAFEYVFVRVTFWSSHFLVESLSLITLTLITLTLITLTFISLTLITLTLITHTLTTCSHFSYSHYLLIHITRMSITRITYQYQFEYYEKKKRTNTGTLPKHPRVQRRVPQRSTQDLPWHTCTFEVLDLWKRTRLEHMKFGMIFFKWTTTEMHTTVSVFCISWVLRRKHRRIS